MERLKFDREKKYSRCFVGIPLPTSFLPKFMNLLADLAVTDSDLRLVDPRTAHATLYYLGDQNGETLEAVAEIVSGFARAFSGVRVFISSMDFFQSGETKIIFLEVSGLEEVANTVGQVAARLRSFSEKEENLPFHPHLTVARKRNSTVINERTAARLSEVDWEFMVEELAICGVDPTEEDPYQKILISLPVTNE